MNLKLDHIGVVVSDIEKSQDYYKKNYGFDAATKKFFEPAHGVNVLFINIGYGQTPAIELIEPINEKSKVYNFLKKTGGGFHHLAYQVDDIKKAIEHYKSQKSLVITEIVPGAGHGNVPTVWLYTPEKNLVELIEIKNGQS